MLRTALFPAAPGRTVLAAKLNPPPMQVARILRPAVLERMSLSRGARLILLRAPAGFGKTTLMLQGREALEAQGTTTAWLTLDSADNDVTRFVYYLACTVSAITQEPAEIVIPSPGGAGRSLGDLAMAVTDRLAMLGEPFALFLDDFERIHEPAVLGLVHEIIENLPRHGQVVIGSRTVPELALGRLRARGQLLEIDADLLRFSPEETVEYMMANRRVRLQHDDVMRLHRKTEGWVAALWLASVALERHDDPGEFIRGFSGSNRAIAEYLAQDVLDRQPAHIRAFLLRTSILGELNAALCDAICNRQDSALLLEGLERSNVFLASLAGDEKTWRYHRLFSDFLRTRLARDMPNELTALHRAASYWYESQQRPVPAIDHAIRGGDFERAMGLLDHAAQALLSQGRMRLLMRWFEALPAEALAQRPRLTILNMWALCFTRGAWEGMALLERSGWEQSDDPYVQAHLNALRPILLGMTDRYEDAHEVGATSLARLPTASAFADTVLINSMANAFLAMGNNHEARRMLEAARRAQGANASSFNVMYSESVEGCIDLRAGRLRQAMARFQLALSATHRAAHGSTSGNAWAGILYAGARYEINDLEQATRLLHVYVPLMRDVGLADHIIMGYLMMSRIAFCRGEVDQAFQTLCELEYVGHERHLPRVVGTAKLERARILLLQGHHDAAHDELDQASEPDFWHRLSGLRMLGNDLEYLEMGRLRWEILAGDPQQALASLADETAAAQQMGHLRRVLKLRMLHALALERTGQRGAAFDVLAEALPGACTEGFVRIIVDEGNALGLLIRRFDAATRDQGARRRDPIFSEYLQRLLQAFGPEVTDAESAPDPSTPAAEPIGPLTRKEILVLQLLAEGYSNSAMAEKLFVTDSTVRTHLRNINSKLSVHSRTRAVAVARSLGMIR